MFRDTSNFSLNDRRSDTSSAFRLNERQGKSDRNRHINMKIKKLTSERPRPSGKPSDRPRPS